MRRHVSAEVLARYQEGDLRARRAASVAAHVSACERCARTGAELAAVSRLLSGMEQPAMPAALADRLSLAIARESQARAASAVEAAASVEASESVGAAGAPSAGQKLAADKAAPAREHIPGRPDLPERSTRRRASQRRVRWPSLSSPLLLRGTAAIAVVVVLVTVGFLLASGTTRPPSAGTSSGATGLPSANAGEHRAASRPEPAGLTGAARLHYRLHGKIVAATALASDMNFTRAGFAEQVQRAMASQVTFGPGYVSSRATPGPQNGRAGGSAALGGIKVGTLNGCLSRVSAGRQVVLAEIARYLGRPATIIVLKSTAANILDVAVVGLACSASAADYIVRTTVPAR